MVIKLPIEKLKRTQALVEEWVWKVVCKKKDLESLLGHLQHAATVVRPGRTFVRRLIELLASVKDARRWIRLNAATRSDLQWWSHFLEEWNGVSMLPRLSEAGFEVHSDASGTWGCGAYWDSHWLWWEWRGPSMSWDISAKELLPILFALVVWGPQWRG